MSAPPIPCLWTGSEFRPMPRFLSKARDAYGAGEIVTLAPIEERSEASHRQEFAWLREAWETLPDRLGDAYPSVEHLRKAALIMTGWCHTRDYPCPNRKEAVRLAAALKYELDAYTVVLIEDAVVRVCRAKSQAKNKMKAADFQASKSDIMRWVGDLIGVDPKVFAARDTAGEGSRPNPAVKAA